MGASSLIWAILIKLLIPEKWFMTVRLEDTAASAEMQEEESMVANWRKNHAHAASGRNSQGFYQMAQGMTNKKAEKEQQDEEMARVRMKM